MAGKANKRIAFITAYRVCKQNDPGPKTFKTQKYLLLREQMDQTTIDPRQKLLDDLADFIEHKVGEGDEIILAIGANESIKESDVLCNFLLCCDLYNLLSRQ